jgi:uncharacterized membrane protein
MTPGGVIGLAALAVVGLYLLTGSVLAVVLVAVLLGAGAFLAAMFWQRLVTEGAAASARGESDEEAGPRQ